MPINMSVEYPKLEAENQKLKRLLHDLTPGGSEFYNDPEYCAKWIRENRQEQHYSLAGMIKKEKEANEKLQQDNTRLREIGRDMLEALKRIKDLYDNVEDAAGKIAREAYDKAMGTEFVYLDTDHQFINK